MKIKLGDLSLNYLVKYFGKMNDIKNDIKCS